ncbi:MAG: antitoxin MazE family protein, partial [Chromatiaceae bacterium]
MGSTNSTYPERHRAYRDRLKARGMRQIVLWVPDTRRPGFAEEIRRQLALVEGSAED